MMNVKVIQNDGKKFAFRIPQPPTKFRCNCKWGAFVKNSVGKNLSEKKADEAGFIVGSSLEMILVWHEEDLKTIPPNYINEPFQDIYGIPIGGELHQKLYPANASELIMFSIHRKSKRYFEENFSTQLMDESFIEWVKAGMPGDANEFASKFLAESFFKNKLRFEFVADSSEKGDYFWVRTTLLPIEKKDILALSAVQFGQELFELQQSASQQKLLGPCYEPEFGKNSEQKALGAAKVS